MLPMELPKRKTNRIKYYDYSSGGAYFVTICTEGRKNLLCTIVGDGSPVPKLPGQIAEQFIGMISTKYPSVSVRKYVIMPNHIHLLLLFCAPDGTGNPSPTLGNVVGWYKYNATKQINLQTGSIGTKLFQRSFHDHVIRGEKDYQKIWEYIEHNPLRWQEECFYTAE